LLFLCSVDGRGERCLLKPIDKVPYSGVSKYPVKKAAKIIFMDKRL
jgi:hypothetical protein